MKDYSKKDAELKSPYGSVIDLTDNSEANNCEERRKHRRGAPMKLNEAGEVVFAFGPDENPPKDHPIKPTPLMLVNEISRMFGNTLHELNEDPLMQGSSREMLFHLTHKDGRTQLELAHLCRIKPPSVSVALRKLEENGYIERRSDDYDMRKTRVFLTEKGRSIDIKVRSVTRELDKRATANLTNDEVKQLCRLLFIMRESISENETKK